MASAVWRIEFDPAANRDFRKLDQTSRSRILRYLRRRIATADDPRRFGRALLGDLKGFWRYRVGDLCIVAKIEDDRFIVLIVRIGHRREVYD